MTTIGSGVKESKELVKQYLDRVNKDIKSVTTVLKQAEITPTNALLPTPPVQKQSQTPPTPPVETAVPPAPVSLEQAQPAAEGQGVAVPATPVVPPKPKLKRKKVRLGLSVSPREVERARKKFGKIGSVRIASVKELAQDPKLKQAWFEAVNDATEEQWQHWVENQLSVAEGLSNDGTGQAVIIPDNLAIYDTDASRAKRNLTSAGEEAMVRVLFHENWHGIEQWLQNTPEAKELHDRYQSLLNEIAPEEMDDMAQRRYPEYSDWKNNSEFKRLLQSEVMAERREEAELTGEPDSLIEKFLAWLRDVFKAVSGSTETPTHEELQELFDAWYRAQKSGVVTSEIQFSQPEIPQRPTVPLPAYEDRGTGNTLDEVLDSMWRPFYVAWESRQGEAGLPLDQNALKKAWSEEVSNAERLFDKDLELRMQKRNEGRNWISIQLPKRELTAPETGPRQTKRKASKTPEPTKEDILSRFPQFSQPEQTPEQRQARLSEIADRLSYTPSVEEQEGMTPAKATKDQRKYATDGTDVELYREGVTGAEIDQLSNEAMAHAIALSPDGPSQDFGKELVKYLNGQIPTLNGLPNNQFLKAAIALNLEHSPLQRNQLGIDSQDIRKAVQQILSVAGRTLKAASQGRLYEPLRKMLEQAEEMTSKEAKAEIGTDDFKSISDAGNAAKVKEVKEAVDDLMPNMPVIIEAAQNDADATDLFELGMEGMDPKLAKKITELNERVERLGRLRQMRARMTAGQKGPAASLPEIPANMTLAELDKLIAEEEAAIRKLVDEVDKAQKKATAKPREKKSKKVANNATFIEYVDGKETAGLPPFVDLVKKYVQADSFNSDAFSTLLANSFKKADPMLIQGVVRRISEALNGSATEEGIQDDLKKAVNYDARAKRIVATEISKGSTDIQEDDTKPDPFIELTKQRLKGEISATAYKEGLKRLGVEDQTSFAMLQKVDQDRARIGDAEAARKVGTEARKNMEKAVKDAKRETEKHEKEALRQIESTSAQFDENAPDKPKRISELQRLKESFLGKSGPPITEDQFIQQVQDLNVKPETAQKLASWLNASRRSDAMDRYQKALQKAQEAKRKAIEAMVKKLDKVKNPTPQKLKKRSKFLNLVQEGMNSGILDSDLVRAAFAQAYDLHGLTPERLKDMSDLMNQIESLPNSMEKETFYLRFMQLLNEIAPASSLSSMTFSAYMGYVLQGAGTMIAQTSNLANFLTPLAFAHSFGQIYATTQGPPLKKMLTALSVRRNWNMAVTGMKESWANLGLIRAGLSGVVTSTGQGLGVTPIELTGTPYETSLAWTPWGQISEFRLKSNKLMENMGVLKLFKATRLPAWVSSRSFQVIRGAEGWSGGVEKNMAFRRVAVAELQNQGKSYDEAWRMVDEALTGKSNKQMWDEAYAKADELIKDGTVNKSARLQKATELVQDMLDEKWNLMLANRHRQQSAMANFKTDPLTPLGAGAYGFVARALENNHWGPIPNPLRFGFLFPRFFINSMEQAYMYSPAGLLTSIGLPSSLPDSKMKERQQRIVEIYGSLENYKQQRLGKGFTGTALLTGIGGLMTAAMQMWDPDDDEPPAFWLTGDVIGRYDKRGILSETGWWAPNTMYLMGMKFNYVNASPQFGIILNAAGNIGDRYMFPELLGTKYNARTKQYEKSFSETWVRPIGEATAAPMSRSTYRVFYDAVDNALGGDFKKLIRLVTQPATGSATALTLGVVPSLKTFEKGEKSGLPFISEGIQPRSPQDVSQTLQAGVPFANALGLDTGKPLYSPFGEDLTPYNFFTFLSNSQESTDDSKRAAKILIDLGVSKQPPKLEYLGDGVVEIAHDGKYYALPPEQRNDLILRMGQELARTIVREKSNLQKLEKDKGRNAVSDKVGIFAADARKKVLSRFKPEK